MLREEQGRQAEGLMQDGPNDQVRVGSECVQFVMIDAISRLQEQTRREILGLVTEGRVQTLRSKA